MTFRQFAFNNVLRNKRTYAAYFLSSAFSVMVFFMYAIFAFHPGLTEGGLHNAVASGMHFAEAIIYVFSFFFVLYSMSAFLKTRKKEFGLMVMHGMTTIQLRTMVFLENILIGFFATISGIGVGLISAKLILLMAENLLELDKTLPFYLPVEAIILTFVAFMLLFIVISLFTVVILRSKGLIELLRSSEKPKPEPRTSVFLSVLAILLLAIGYGIALWVRGLEVVLAMIPVTVIVIIGTYFLFTQFSVYLVRLGRSKRTVFWKRTNLLLFSDLAYRMKDNARMFFIVAILSTVAFSAVGSLVGFKSMYTTLLLEEEPFALEYHSYADQPETEKVKHIQTITEALEAEGIAYEYASSEIMQVPLLGSEQQVLAVTLSDYQAFARTAGVEAIELADDETMMLYYVDVMNSSRQIEAPHTLELAGLATPLTVVEAQSSYLFPVYTRMFVVSDDILNGLSEASLSEQVHVFHVEDWQVTREVGKQLSEELPRGPGSYYFSSVANELHRLNQGYGAILFVGFFIGAVFFVAAGSFLYFRMFTDLEDDKRKFAAVRKIGLTDKELSGIISKQLAVLFLVPILIATVHGAVALTALQNMFSYSLVKESAIVLGTFVLIQCVYYVLIRARYLRQVKSVV